MPDFVVTPELKQMLEAAGIDPNLAGKIDGGAWYTTLLEKGSSQKAPLGVYAAYRPEYGQMLKAAMEAAAAEAIARGKPLGPALQKGFDNGIKEILRGIEAHTPVKTGRARSSWVATLSNGRRVKAIKVVGTEAAYKRKRRRERRASSTS